MSPSSRWLVAIAATVAALVLVSVVVALVTPRGRAGTLPEDTPEGVVQRFVVAIKDQDYNQAHSYLSDRLKTYCTVRHMQDTTRQSVDQGNNQRVALLDTQTLSDSRVEVRVQVTQVNISPPFGVNEYSHEERYVLIQEGGEWRIDEPPWPVGWCPGLEGAPPKPFPVTTPG